MFHSTQLNSNVIVLRKVEWGGGEKEKANLSSQAHCSCLAIGLVALRSALVAVIVVVVVDNDDVFLGGSLALASTESLEPR